MNPHVCQDNWPRVYRLMLSLVLWDDLAYKLVTAELGDCLSCTRNALATVLHLHINNYVLQAGGLDKAAEYLTDELQGLLMPMEGDADRMAQRDRQNRAPVEGNTDRNLGER